MLNKSHQRDARFSRAPALKRHPMDYSQFLVKLEEGGFERQGTSSAFKEIDDWLIAFIGLSGRFQQAGTKAFVICARPRRFGYMDAPKKKYPTEPMEYPYKLTLDGFSKKLQYQSQLLRFDHSRLDTESDWSNVYNVVTNKLPAALKSNGVSGLVSQLEKIKSPGYVEKIWLGVENA